MLRNGWSWRRHPPGMQISYRCTESAFLDSMMVGLEADNLEKMSHAHKILCSSSWPGHFEAWDTDVCQADKNLATHLGVPSSLASFMCNLSYKRSISSSKASSPQSANWCFFFQFLFKSWGNKNISRSLLEHLLHLIYSLPSANFFLGYNSM